MAFYRMRICSNDFGVCDLILSADHFEENRRVSNSTIVICDVDLGPVIDWQKIGDKLEKGEADEFFLIKEPSVYLLRLRTSSDSILFVEYIARRKYGPPGTSISLMFSKEEGLRTIGDIIDFLSRNDSKESGDEQTVDAP